jgi:hypothetical protein
MPLIFGNSDEQNLPGVKGTSSVGDGVVGEGNTSGVVGVSNAAEPGGVFGDNIRAMR